MHSIPGVRETVELAAAWTAVAAVTAIYVVVVGTANHTIAALTYLLVVLVAAALSTQWVAISASVLAFLCFNYFFFAPVRTLRIDSAADWVSLFTLLGVSIVGIQLSARARRRTREAVAQRDELARVLAERARLLKEREEAETVRRSHELKSALLTSLSHDLRTPLTALTVAADNLSAPWLSDDQRRDQIGIVRFELARLNRLFQNLVEMARIELDAVAMEYEWVSPSEIVEAAVGQLDQTLGRRQVDIETTAEKTLVRVDPRLTSAALAQVLENAVRYSPADTPITVRIDASPDSLSLRVRDRGPGIAPADLDRVFERSYRGRNVGTSFGTGMGLAITRGLVAAQGGRVAAENAPDGGAVFTIVVPAGTRTAPAVEEQT